jgi:hypothetical protein
VTTPTLPVFSSYVPPDVYVADTSSPVVIATGVNPQVLTIVGPALGYRTAVQSFPVYAATPAQLQFQGVFTTAQTGPPAIPAPTVVITGTSAELAVGVDYSFTTTPDPSGNPALAITTVSRVSSSSDVTDGQQVTITYSYADASYYAPQVLTSSQAVINAYGPALTSSVPSTPNASQVANPLSFAAQIAFTNGANQIITVACNPANGSLEEQLAACYAQIATTAAATIVVPVFPDDLTAPSGTASAYALALATDLNTACVNASSSGFPRIGLFGLPRNYSETTEPVPSFTSSLSSRWITVAYPEIVQVFNTMTQQTFNAAGCYLAVALGATLSSLPVDQGLTRQVLNGFQGLTATEVQNMTPTFMNTLAASGACIVTQSANGTLFCRHGITTDTSALNYSEISLVRQAQALFTSVQSGMENSGLIGQPITATMAATVQGALLSILEQAVSSSIIVSYTNVAVSQEVYPGGNPSIMQCSFSYQPAVPLNYIEVTFSIDLTSGAVSTQSQQNAATPVTSG